MSKFHIAMLSMHSCPLGQLGTRDTGGMNVYVRELARELGNMGHEVDIFTRAHDPRDAQVENPFENVRLIHIRAGRVEDMGKMAQLSHLPEFLENMSAFVAGDGSRCDLIHSHYWLSGLAGAHFSRAWGIPQLMMFHTLGAIKNSLPVGDPEPAVRLRAEQELVRGCQRLVAATEKEKHQLVGYYGARPERINVIPCGVNTSLFQPVKQQAARQELGLAEKDKIILSVGRIEPLKGLDRLIEAFSLLRKPGFKLLIIGGDEFSQGQLARLKAFSERLGVDGSVEFLGTVKQDRLPLYYSAADATVVASYYESFCLIILESLACGTPVVSTDVGVAGQVIQNGLSGCLVRDSGAVALAAGIERVLATAYIDVDVSSTVRRYSWSAIAAEIAGVYGAILASRSRTEATACAVDGS